MVCIDNKVPILERGNILDNKILNNMQDTPYDFLKLQYLDHSDGVLAGIKLYAKDYDLIIAPGIIKWKGFYYRVYTDTIIKIPKEDGDYIFKIRFLPTRSIEEEKYTLYRMEVFHTFDKSTKDDEMEIMHIKRREGAIVRNISVFPGINEEYNIINEITKVQSTSTGRSFPESLLKLFANEVFEKKSPDILDEMFCHSILNGRITRESIRQYILHKLDKDINKNNNKEDNICIYDHLEKIYKNMHNSIAKSRQEHSRNGLLIVE